MPTYGIQFVTNQPYCKQPYTAHQGRAHRSYCIFHAQLHLNRIAQPLLHLCASSFYFIIISHSDMSSLQSTLAIATKELKNAFNTFDTDKSGNIERHELGTLLKRLTDAFDVEEPSDDDINEILKELDANGDGKISQAEFEALVVEVVKIIEEERSGSKAE